VAVASRFPNFLPMWHSKVLCAFNILLFLPYFRRAAATNWFQMVSGVSQIGWLLICVYSIFSNFPNSGRRKSIYYFFPNLAFSSFIYHQYFPIFPNCSPPQVDFRFLDQFGICQSDWLVIFVCFFSDLRRPQVELNATCDVICFPLFFLLHTARKAPW